MNQPLRTLTFVGIGLIAGLGIYKFLLAPSTTRDCCKTEDVCDKAPPASVNAQFEQDKLKIDWTAAPEATKYLVNVYNLDSSLSPAAPSKVVEGLSTIIDLPGISPEKEYEVSVAALCDNCVPSSATAKTATCYIVIDDICKYGISCNLCNCNGAVSPTFSGSTATFNFAGTGDEMYKVTLQKTIGLGTRSSFVFNTHKPSSYREVCLKKETDDDACNDESIIENPPVEIPEDCGVLEEKIVLKYKVQITLTQVIISNIPADYTVIVKRCTC